jgi:hypothetical protein
MATVAPQVCDHCEKPLWSPGCVATHSPQQPSQAGPCSAPKCFWSANLVPCKRSRTGMIAAHRGAATTHRPAPVSGNSYGHLQPVAKLPRPPARAVSPAPHGGLSSNSQPAWPEYVHPHGCSSSWGTAQAREAHSRRRHAVPHCWPQAAEAGAPLPAGPHAARQPASPGMHASQSILTMRSLSCHCFPTLGPMRHAALQGRGRSMRGSAASTN